MLALVAAAGCVYAVTLPWVDAGLGTDARRYAGGQLLPVAWTVRIACAATVVAIGAGALMRRPAGRPVAIVSAAFAVVVTGGLIGALETIATMVPDGLLPLTLRRLTLRLSAAEGLWIAFGCALVALIAAVPTPRARLRAGQLVALLVLLAVTVGFATLRYVPWLEAAVAGNDLGFEAWATPWIGPLSLITVWLLASSCVLVLFVPTWVAGLMTAAAGWSMIVLGALALITGASAKRLQLAALVPGELREYAPTLEAVPGAWAALATGLVAALVGALLVVAAPRAPDVMEDEWAIY
jgi:hypothetical protein